MAQSAQIAKLSPKHEDMIRYLIENPCASREQMALDFGVTRAWLSTIIHSEAFQAALKRRQDSVFNSVVARPLQERVLGAAHMALDRLEKKLETEDDTETLRRTFETLAKGAGEFQGEKNGRAVAPIGAVNIFNGVTPEDIARARGLIGSVRQLPEPIEHDPASTPAAIDHQSVQAGGQSLLGAPSHGPALQAEVHAEPALPGGH